MVRAIGGLVLGVAVAMLTITLTEWAGHRIIPYRGEPAGAPASLLAFVLSGWTLGALLGGWSGGAVGRRSWIPWVVAGVIVLGVIASTIMMPAAPRTMLALGIVLPLAAAWIASRLSGLSGSGRRPAR